VLFLIESKFIIPNNKEQTRNKKQQTTKNKQQTTNNKQQKGKDFVPPLILASRCQRVIPHQGCWFLVDS